jgi:hypothetical protein
MILTVCYVFLDIVSELDPFAGDAQPQILINPIQWPDLARA